MDERTRRGLESLYGIVIDPAWREASEGEIADRLMALLHGSGAEIATVDELPILLEREELARWRRVLDPVLAVPEGAARIAVSLRLPESAENEFDWLLIEENGNRRTGTFRLAELEAVSTFRSGKESFVGRNLVLELSLECGYHQLSINPGEGGPPVGGSLTLVVAPATCYIPPGIAGDNRIWGVSLHLHAVRSRRNWGVGDFTDLREILAWGAEQGAGVLNIAPLHEISGFEDSGLNPYAPSSRAMLNPLFVDLEEIDDFRESDEIREQVGNPKFQARLASLRDQEELDFPAVAECKFEIFRLLWHHFSTYHLEPETDRGREFRQFQAEGGELLRAYGVYAALREKFRLAGQGFERGWRGWPAEYREPGMAEVDEFAATRRSEVELYQYVQWQARLQLAAVGRRSMELGLKLGLLTELAFGPWRDGFETWYYRDLYAGDLIHEVTGGGERTVDPALGLPLAIPARLRERRYMPFVEPLRRAMRPAGGLAVWGFHHFFESVPGPVAGDFPPTLALRYGFAEILAILTLESRRNRCLVVVDSPAGLPEEYAGLLSEKGIFTHLVPYRHRDRQGDWPTPRGYPQNGVVSASSLFLQTIKGFWDGRDIVVKEENGIFPGPAAEEDAVVSRASDRAHLLIGLRHEGLLPEEDSVDPLSMPAMTAELSTAVQLFLSRTPARIQLVAFNDLLDMDLQAEPPSFNRQSFWRSRYPLELEKIVAQPEIVALFPVLCRERGVGVVRPSPPATARRSEEGIGIPTSFYRLQLNREFNFLQAAELVEYLSRLGISHVYASPFLMARPGSSHGYDIIDHARLNPEIGSREDFETFVAALERQGMALLLDIVPNHMGVGADNRWWMDVLENGEAVRHAGYFDINWEPLQPELKGKVLLPVLGDHYGKVLENGELRLSFSESTGSFTIGYHEQLFPLAPRTYAAVLGHDLQRLEDRLGEQHNGYLELRNLISSFSNLPPRGVLPEEVQRTRRRDKEVNKRILARLCRENPEVRQFIEENVILFNGEVGRPESFDPLHDLLEGQAYRLAYWRVAADEINYRRFFDINDLAGLRMENPEVFRETHKLILDLITTGRLDGLRVDHPDGLYDPGQYFRRLQGAAGGEFPENHHLPPSAGPERGTSLYVVAEKILAEHEALPDDWPVHGTTGYDFSSLLGGLFVDGEAEDAMTSLYRQFIGDGLDFDNLVNDSKKLIIGKAMAGELNVLTVMLYRLAQSDRGARDFTLNRLRRALTEIVAGFPVYRTYISSARIRRNDVEIIDQALAAARTHAELEDTSVFDFIRSVLLPRDEEEGEERSRRLDFVMKLQQYTGPVMAKGLEDTAFYVYNRLLSLNEVGSNPKRFGVTVSAFHRANRRRMRRWPQSMLNSSTHDSKRSEDVRARIGVLSEMVAEWREKATRWNTWHRRLKTPVGGRPAPDANDEYAFYQNLLGIWPVEEPTAEERQVLVDRLRECMLKTIREAKRNSSWFNPNAAYEEAMNSFVSGVLAGENRRFMEDLATFLDEVAWFGGLSGLSQVLLKLTAPGVPDIYQGNEIQRFCLVDPDNRRPVDFARRRRLLAEIADRSQGDAVAGAGLHRELLDSLGDGRAKLYVTTLVLRLRKSRPEVFSRGDYLPLKTTGRRRRHLCAFARRLGSSLVVVVAPILYRKLGQGRRRAVLEKEVWGDTAVILPPELDGVCLENRFTGAVVRAEGEGRPFLKAAQLFDSWPLALLTEAASDEKES